MTASNTTTASTSTILSCLAAIIADDTMGCYLYSDGADDWDAYNLLDLVAGTEDATLPAIISDNGDVVLMRDDGYRGRTYLHRLDRLTPHAETAYAGGVEDAMPADYDMACDLESPRPWCTPWCWTDASEYLIPGATPEEMGRAWAAKIEDEWRAAVEADTEADGAGSDSE